MSNTFFWFYCVTITFIYTCFVTLLVLFNMTSKALTHGGENAMPILYFQSFMALWAYVFIPACTILMWWAYRRDQYGLAFLFSALPVFMMFFTSLLYVNNGA